MAMEVIIGLDIGGVLTDQKRNDGTDTSFRSDNFLKTTPVEGAFEGVQSLVQRYGADNVFIISKCGPVIESKTRQWLDFHHFYNITGFNRHHLNFCLRRADKAPIAKRLRHVLMTPVASGPLGGARKKPNSVKPTHPRETSKTPRT